jgi:NAD(P)H dehydrogenase (quinone)
MVKIAIVYHRTSGHTKFQSGAVHRGAQSFSAAPSAFYTVEEATARVDELDAADAIIFGCPTYMRSMSAGTFLEAAAEKWFTLAWKEKVPGPITNSSFFSGEKLNTLVGVVINAMQHGTIFVGPGTMPSNNRPEEIKSVNCPGPEAHNRLGSFIGPMAASFQVSPLETPTRGDIETAEAYGRRVAEITIQLFMGRQVA